MFAYNSANVILTDAGEPERLQMRLVSHGIFPTLGIKPIHGRPFTPEEDKVGAERVVLLGEGFWLRRFAGDPGVIGKTLVLNGEPFTVIGVLPTRGFHSTWWQFDLFTPLWRLEDRLGGPDRRGNHPGIYSFARMKPGVTFEQARTEMKAIAKRLEQEYPNTNKGNTANVEPVLDAIVGDLRGTLLLLLAAVGFVLLIACANVAHLLLARAAERQKEVAVRAALGAGRWRLVRQLLTESLLLALCGGALGLLLGIWGTDALVSAVPSGTPRIQEVSLDSWVLLFSLGVTIFTGLFFGTFPALHIARSDLHETLKEGGRSGGAGVGRRRMRSALVVAEVAVSLVLLVGAGLMTKSLLRVLQADAGIDPTGVLVVNFTLPQTKYGESAQRRQFILEVVDKIRALPGVEYAGFKNPLLGTFQTGFIIEGRPLPEPGQGLSTDIGRVSPDALPAMGIRLLKGRYFTEQDNETAPRVCIIDETMARTHWPNQEPLGQRMALGGGAQPGMEPQWMTIVGVVAHVKHYGVDQPSRVETYVPVAQDPMGGGWLVLRTSLDPASLTGGVRAAVASVDRDVPIFGNRRLVEIVEDTTAQRRLAVFLMGAFAALALLLAAVGLYGVISYSVAQRTHEIGVRMALGAHRQDILLLILRHGLGLTLVGLALGVGGALYLSRFLESQLFEVQARDPATFLAIPLVLAAVALLASWIPARRAAKVDPMVALRYE
jgi:predicted permease